MHSRFKKVLIISVLVITAILAACFLFFRFRGHGSDTGVYVEPVSSMNGSLTSVNRFRGVVENQKSTDITYDTSRKLKEVYVSVGDHVNKGDKLFSYDTVSLELEIQQLQVQIELSNNTIANNQAQITQLQSDMSRASAADKPGFSAQILQAQADIAQAEYDIKMKQNEITSKQTSLANSTVTAASDATVRRIATVITDESGNTTIQNDESGNPSGEDANTFMVLQADGEFRIKGTVSEQAVYELYEGMPVLVRSRVDMNQTWSGSVTSVNTDSTVQNENMYMDMGQETSSNYNFYVSLDSIDGLIIGQHVTVELSDGNAAAGRDGLWISSGYIVTEENGTSYVWTVSKPGKGLRRVEVELGEYDEMTDEIQILTGLEASDYIAWPDENCKDGARTISAESYE